MVTDKGLLAKSDREIFSSATEKGAESTCTGDRIIETISLLYLRFALHIEKSRVRYCCREASELFFLTPELRRTWQKRGENVQDHSVSQEDGTHSAPSNSLPLRFSHRQYSPSVTNIKVEMESIVDHEAGKEQWTRLLPMQELVAQNV